MTGESSSLIPDLLTVEHILIVSSVNCPEGGYTCGMTSVTPWQTITGNQHSCGGGSWPACVPCGDHSYAIQVPAQTAEISWAACIASDSVNQETSLNLEKCP